MSGTDDGGMSTTDAISGRTGRAPWQKIAHRQPPDCIFLDVAPPALGYAVQGFARAPAGGA